MHKGFRPPEVRLSVNDQVIDYNMNILVGVRENGVMAVIADWPYVPPQAEVQTQIDCTGEPYVTFVLCTPTSIMAHDPGGRRPSKPTPSRFGPTAPVRRR
jgi:hypothetical protein